MRELMDVVAECYKELDSIGVPYNKYIDWKINTRAKKRMGSCNLTNCKYTIQMASDLLKDDSDLKTVKTAFIHEILHTVPDGMKHTGGWKQWATQVNSLLGYNVARCYTQEEGELMGIREDEIVYKYVFVCKDCGQVVKRMRASRFTKNYKEYKCRCGGSFSFGENSSPQNKVLPSEEPR